MPLPLPGDGRCSVVASVWRGVREDRHRSLSQWLNDEIDCAQRMDPSVIDHPRNPRTGESLAPKDHLNAVHFSVRTVCTVRKAPIHTLCLEDQAFPAFSHKAGGHVLWYFSGILRVECFERLYSRQHILCCRRDFHLQGIQKRGGISTDLRIAVSNAMQVVKLPWGEVLCCCHDFCKRFP